MSKFIFKVEYGWVSKAMWHDGFEFIQFLSSIHFQYRKGLGEQKNDRQFKNASCIAVVSL